MPIDFEHDAERKLLTIRMHGDLSDEDLIGYANHAVVDEQIEAATNDFIDLSAVVTISASSEALRRVNAILVEGGRTRNEGKMAILAPTDLAFGMARMFQSYHDAGAIEVQVFRTAHEARAWLALD